MGLLRMSCSPVPASGAAGATRPPHPEGPALILDDTLPPAKAFRVAAGSHGWSAHPGCPDWLLKRKEKVYFHAPTSSLWHRRRNDKALVRVDVYQRALGGFATSVAPVLLRALLTAWAQESADARQWRDDDVDGACGIDEVPRPRLRTAPKGLRRTRRGVSPPPLDGWSEATRGWQRHDKAPNWLRKAIDLEGSGQFFFYIPTESLWMQMPTGVFACADTYHSALAVFMSAVKGTHMRTCLLAWRGHVRVTQEWRKKIQFFGSDAEDTANEETTPIAWPVRAAFLNPQKSRRSRKGKVRFT